MEDGSWIVDNIMMKKDGLSLIAFLIDGSSKWQVHSLKLRAHFVRININNHTLTENQPFSCRPPM
jgi:hypothetical protein